MRVSRVTASVIGASLIVVGSAAPALAADSTTPTPPENTCYPLLSSLVCQVPVNVGPFDIPVTVAPNLHDIIGVPSTP